MVQGFVDIRQLTIPCPNHLGIFTSKLATQGSDRGQLDSPSSQYPTGSNGNGNALSDSVMLDINSYTFIDMVGESVVAREYAPVLDGYFDDHISQVAQGMVSDAATDLECTDTDAEAPLGTQPGVTSTDSNKATEDVVAPGETAGREGLGATSAGGGSPSSSNKTPDHSGPRCLTEKDRDVLSRESELPTEHSPADPNVASSAAMGTDSFYPTDICDTSKDSDKLSSTNTYRSNKETSLELEDLAADGSSDEAGKPDWDETPMPLQEEGYNERDGMALPTITMALISRRSRHRAGTVQMRSKPRG